MSKDNKIGVLVLLVLAGLLFGAHTVGQQLTSQPKPVTSQAVASGSSWTPEKQPVVTQPDIAKPNGNYTDLSTLPDLHNQLRQEQGVPPMAVDGDLALSAYLKCQDMQVNNYWAHDNPNGNYEWVSWLTKAGASYIQAGENLYHKQDGKTPDMVYVMRLWWNSPTHKDNMLKSKWQRMGFAECHGVLGQIIVAHFAY